MELNTPEIRRQLRDVDAMNTEAVKPWRESLLRLFGGSGATSAEKAHALGVPGGRRQFFRVGGATLIGAAVLAACGDDDDGGVASTGEGADATTGEDDAAPSGVDDLTLVRTAASLEALAVATYETAAGSGLVTTPAVGEAAALFMDHHQQHLDALNAVAEQNGGEAVTDPNAAVKAAVVDPAVEAAATEEDILRLALDLEKAAAQTYVFAGGTLSQPEFRATIMTIGGVESRHAIILGNVLALSAEELYPNAFYKSQNPLPEDALITG